MRLIICYLYLFLFSISYCLGQGRFGKITSQPADFIRYGLTPVSYFSGKVSVEIPLYTLQDPDFSMPLSLSYTSDGLEPAKHPGLVGLDWVVNFGGVITREVYGAMIRLQTADIIWKEGFGLHRKRGNLRLNNCLHLLLRLWSVILTPAIYR